MKKLLPATLRLSFVVTMAAWLILVPHPANAQFGPVQTCTEFWSEALMWCNSYQGYLCGGACFEYTNCPLGCSEWDWCCCDDWGCECCETDAYGYADCCW